MPFRTPFRILPILRPFVSNKHTIKFWLLRSDLLGFNRSSDKEHRYVNLKSSSKDMCDKRHLREPATERFVIHMKLQEQRDWQPRFHSELCQFKVPHCATYAMLIFCRWKITCYVSTGLLMNSSDMLSWKSTNTERNSLKLSSCRYLYRIFATIFMLTCHDRRTRDILGNHW